MQAIKAPLRTNTPLNNYMHSTWNSAIGKRVKKDPDHGWLWKKIKNFLPIKLINFCGPHN